jgi:membrane protein DedA with SNARE-associated domain
MIILTVILFIGGCTVSFLLGIIFKQKLINKGKELSRETVDKILKLKEKEDKIKQEMDK